MKINWNNKYNTIAVYAFLVLALASVFFLIASEISLFKIQMSKYIATFQPIIIGLVLAYIFNFILNFYEKHINKMTGPKIKKKLIRIGSIILTYTTVALILYFFFNFALPQLISSVVGLVNKIPAYVREASQKINEFSQNYQLDPAYYDQVMAKWDEAVDYILNFATNLIPVLANFAKGTLSSIWNIVLGLIVSIYLLMDKEKFIGLGKKVSYGILPEKAALRLIRLVKRSDNIFGNFLGGKILDSFIVGVLTFFILWIFKMPYSLLISFVVGVTNIIPFFGPFIGAIPSFFIIAFEAPVKALWFLLIILVIQQIDGNIIGPAILGDSLGISPFWILFSLLVAGKLFGFVGLIIGVPLFVLIYSIIKDLIEESLDKKGLPTETQDYYDYK